MTSEERALGARIFAALGHPTRLQIVEYLSNASASVNEIALATGLKQSITSQHLADLLDAGVLICTPKGNKRIYTIRGPRIKKILKLAEEFYAVHIDSLREILARYS